MIQAGLDGRLVQVNQKYADMLGYTREELRGMSSDVITHPEDLAETLQTRRSLVEGRLESASSEKRLVRKDGRVIWVNRTVSVARDPAGEPLSAVDAKLSGNRRSSSGNCCIASRRRRCGSRDITVRQIDRKSTRLNSSHLKLSRMPSSA